jgi:polyhydroxybutyrate depolymerase
MFRTSRPVAVLLVSLLVMAGACSDDDGGDEGAPSSTPGSTAPASGTGADRDDGPCSPAEGAAPGTDLVEVTSGGATRRVQRSLPETIGDGERHPLVVDLHGFSSSIEQQNLFSGMPEKATRRGYVVLTPEGLATEVRVGDDDLEAAAWNIGNEGAEEGGVDDVAFLAELIEEAVADLCVDPDRVHLSGNSMGAAMATTMACARPDLVASIAPVSGVNLAPTCTQPEPVPVLGFHGDADPIVPFEGGSTAGEWSGLATVSDRMEELAAAAGCDPDGVTQRIQDDIDHTVWPNCDDGVDVELYRVLGGGHTWPGMLDYVDFDQLAALGQDQPLVEAAGLDLATVAGNMTTSISASDLALDFFDAHPARN